MDAADTMDGCNIAFDCFVIAFELMLGLIYAMNDLSPINDRIRKISSQL